MRNLIIFGDSQFSERISKYIIAEGKDRLIAFTQEKQYMTRCVIDTYKVIPFEDLSSLKEDFEIILGVGYSNMNTLRSAIYNLIKSTGYKVGTYTSTHAICYSDDIGEGTFICPGAVVGPGCRIGIANYIASCAVLSHDNQIGNFNFISTSAVFGGFAKVEDRCFFGLNTTVKDNVTVASENLIGSAANVIKSISYRGGVYIGNPVQILSDKNLNTIEI